MKVLLVDDNDDFLNAMQELLKGFNFEPIVARDGKQAREALEELSVDAIICDVFMPTLDGVRFHSYVREFLGQTETPFIFMSGYNDPYIVDALENSKVDFFFSKTTPITEVIATLEQFRTTIRG